MHSPYFTAIKVFIGDAFALLEPVLPLIFKPIFFKC
jgi:hypothetical protein